MSFNPRTNRNEKDAIGDPGDSIATNTTEAWTTISLLKAVANRLGLDSGATAAADVAQGSTTAGQVGGLQQAAVTTAAPTYTTGKTNPLSLTTSGDLRVANAGLLAVLPASLGTKLKATSLAVTLASDEALTVAVATGNTEIGAVTETAPGSDTASSGLNGRLQRIAQRLTSLIALVPASLGQKTMTASMAVVVASDQTTFPVSPGATSVTGGISTTARLAAAAASTNATNVKTSAGRIYSAQGYNAAAYTVYLVLYDSASNPPVPGTTTIRKKIPIPATTAFALDWPVGLSFATGIGYAFTKLPADADTTVLVASDILQFNLDYV